MSHFFVFWPFFFILFLLLLGGHFGVFWDIFGVGFKKFLGVYCHMDEFSFIRIFLFCLFDIFAFGGHFDLFGPFQTIFGARMGSYKFFWVMILSHNRDMSTVRWYKKHKTISQIRDLKGTESSYLPRSIYRSVHSFVKTSLCLMWAFNLFQSLACY